MKQKLFTRNVTFLVFGQFSSLIGNYTLKFACSMYVLEQTGSAGVFAALLAVAMIPTVLLSPFGGMLADRLNRRNIMVALDVLSGLSVLAAILLSCGSFSIPLLGVLLIILSVLGAFESPTVQACVPQMLSGDNIIKGNAVINQIQALASLITPFAGSIFYVAFGITPVMAASAACFFLTALLECFIRLERPKILKRQSALQIIKGDLGDSMHFLRKEQPGVLKLLFLTALVSLFAMGVVTVGFPFLVRTVLGLSAEHYGAAESMMGIAAILGGIAVSLFANRWKLNKLYWLMVMMGACLFPAGAAFLLPVSPFVKYLVLVAAFFIGQALCSIFSVCALTAIQGRTPQQLTGKIMSYVMTISLCAQPLGQFVYGILFDAFQESVWWVLVPTGAVILSIGWLSSGFFSRLQEETIKPENT